MIMADESDYFSGYKIGGYRLGTNLPMQGAVWENVARASRWGAPVIEVNTRAELLGSNALQVMKEMAKANDLTYTWHIPPNADESGELALIDDASNHFARKVFIQAMKASLNIGAKHITFHPTLKAGREPDNGIWIYDEINKQAKLVRKPIESMSRDEAIANYDKSQKNELTMQFNQLQSNISVINKLGDITEAIEKYGVDKTKMTAVKGIIEMLNSTSSTVKLSPPDIDKWQLINDKVTRGEVLNIEEEAYIRAFAKSTSNQVGNWKFKLDNEAKQLKPYVDKEHLISDGINALMKNVADNFGKMVDDDRKVFEEAMRKGMSIGIENLPAFQLFSTPEEMNAIRKMVVDKLVEKNFDRKLAEDFVGFTFDISHANMLKYLEIGGKRYAGPKVEEFPDKLKGPIKHVHAQDNTGFWDGHLPLGQGEIAKEGFEKIKEALKRSGFKGTAIHELGGSQIPALYQATMAFVEPGMYSIGEMPTSSQWGPSYLEASMTDPLVFSSQERGYFNETFGEIF